ncbi:phosphatidylethanolamine-binding protein [Lophiotrema nucula]|uniref:Phosphatidylethanolamine-binding protein n=1 Tax=Lophiotrema nucula TaxID=690887 RepID=A0A6A5YFZ5_9PLEO|nr:phosphatidylethanolamine-binding protein [Lophiotrema nucula]
MALSQFDPAAPLASLSGASLIPSPLIPETFSPTVTLRISFGAKAVPAGNLFRASECKLAPTVTIQTERNDTSSQLYTLLLVDPDAPTPDDPKFAYWRHWVVSSIQPTQTTTEYENVVKSGKTLTEYLGPGPKDECKPHRYLFLLYREPQGFEVQKKDVGGEEFVQRRSFGVNEWVEKHSLELVGVNWMLGAGDGWKEQHDEL